jgi:L-lactate dehydrogenase (cytochrome)/(S)-mandelate dehydrogenase
VRLDRCLSIEDLHRTAKRRLPRVIYDFVAGGAEDEACLDRNCRDLQAVRLLPRYLVDIARRDLSLPLFGRHQALPFGIAPTGMAALVRRDADLILAEAAREAGIPFILSGASNASIEAVARVNPGAWLQLYVPSRDDITEDILRRAEEAGLDTLVVTADVPVNAKRERNIRSGWVRPYKPTPAIMAEALLHPAWVAENLRHGMPMMQTFQPYAPAGASAREVAAFYATVSPHSFAWGVAEGFRRRWRGKLVIKGLLHPEDARRARDLGVDGIIVSNHGGRQLDRAASAIAALPAIVAAVGDDITVMMDSGIRRGADVLAALCLGARFCFVGRATLYGVAAAGLPGARRAIEILRGEIDLVAAQLGCPRIADLDASWLAATG